LDKLGVAGRNLVVVVVTVHREAQVKHGVTFALVTALDVADDYDGVAAELLVIDRVHQLE